MVFEMSCIGLVSDGLNYLIDWFGLGCWLKWNGLDGSPLPFFGSNPLAETMDSPERSKLRLSPSADCSSSPPFWSPPLPTPSAVASAALADPSVAAAVDPVGRRRRRARRPCRLRRCPPGHQAAVASATLVYALSLSDAAAQGRPPASSTTGPPTASPTESFDPVSVAAATPAPC